MFKKIIYSVFLCFISIGINAQTIKGRVTEAGTSDIGVPFASIKWIGTTTGTVADEKGYFSLPYTANTLLVVSCAGYTSDTLEINAKDENLKITLQKGISLQEARIIKRKKSTEISSLTPRLTVELGRQELQKAACCNLSESFETSPAVDVSYTDALTGSRQIRMLGLDGIYTQLTTEMVPGIRALTAPYGMNFIPGTWINSIQLTKGVGSVINGFESMAGQINIELKKPDNKEYFFADAYVNQGYRNEINTGRNFSLNKYVQTGTMLHASSRPVATDMNRDGFADNPTGFQLSALNRWQYYTPKGFEGMVMTRYTYDKRSGGQTDAHHPIAEKDRYGLELVNENAEIFTKNGYVFKNKPYQSIGSQFSVKYHHLSSAYGNKNRFIEPSGPGFPLLYNANTSYTGRQLSFYGNLLFASIIGTTAHSYTSGVSFQQDNITENLIRFSNFGFKRTESVAGVFTEYTFKPDNQFTGVAGMRADYNNIFGWFFTPRIHTRYMFNHDRTVLRLSAGRGQRTANIFADNQKMFASSRTIHIIPSNNLQAYGLSPEVSWNGGLSLSHTFKLNYRDASLHADFFRTDFKQQVIADYDYNFNQVVFYNLPGKSTANSFQIQFESEPVKRLDVRLAYRWFDVKTDQLNGRLTKALLPPHRAFANFSYKTKKQWFFDATVQWFAASRMPLTATSPENYRQAAKSSSFMLINAQVLKQFTKTFQAYAGIENATNYRQPHPIISADNPYRDTFDATMIWGPVFGAMAYAGCRFTLEKNEPKK